MHTKLISKIYGGDPFRAPDEALAKTYEKLDTDMIFWTLQSWYPWNEAKAKGETFDERTDWSTLFPTTWRPTHPVSSVGDILDYNPEEHVNLDSDHFDEVVAYFDNEHKKKPLKESRLKKRLQTVYVGFYAAAEPGVLCFLFSETLLFG